MMIGSEYKNSALCEVGGRKIGINLQSHNTNRTSHAKKIIQEGQQQINRMQNSIF